MAAGEGKRLRPLTNRIPKALIKVRGKSLISQSIIQLTESVENIIITTGYKGEDLVEHVYNLGANIIIKTLGKGNAWWIFNSLMKSVDEPVLVLPCDNITKLNLDFIFNCYIKSGAPPCMLVPVRPLDNIEGDYIKGEIGTVRKLSRAEVTSIYCSGIQVLNPSSINNLIEPCEDFNDLWKALIAIQKLKYSDVYPEAWYSINNEVQLQGYLDSRFLSYDNI
ncbi:nucleotidyltransferase family protein [Albibacterium indicum]|uniref:nucleotidyltransferase family protein n=1 Tax=Albibacterium indicum TaxID=2292082 RepID=UPI0013006F8F|nr:sugar phosphate nucleotidyltransferase [Pedobacter indicus]